MDLFGIPINSDFPTIGRVKNCISWVGNPRCAAVRTIYPQITGPKICGSLPGRKMQLTTEPGICRSLLGRNHKNLYATVLGSAFFGVVVSDRVIKGKALGCHAVG